MKTNKKAYLPLIVVVALAIAMALAICKNLAECSAFLFMSTTMGIFLCLLSMFKFFNLSGFVDGFSMYDLITQRLRAYGYIYPFIEVSLGLCFIAGFLPLFINVITMVVMAISAIGVIKAISQGMNLRCACLGTVLNIPLSTVSIVENIGMSLMALMNIITLLS